MAKFEEHCEESIRLFGKPYAEVHRWLDAFAGSKEYGYRHRKKRHHEAGIRQAIELFGEEAGPVARQHIITDLKDEGWTEQDHFPRDEQDYVKMGFFESMACGTDSWPLSDSSLSGARYYSTLRR